MKDAKKELWELFEKTGNINCYLLYKKIEDFDKKKSE